MDRYTFLFLILLLILLSLCFYVLFRLRPKHNSEDPIKTIHDIPHLNPRNSKDLFESFHSHSESSDAPSAVPNQDSPPYYVQAAILKWGSPHYIPTFLWECIDVIEYRTGSTIPFHSKAYLWAAYFYVFAKTIRSQSIVDELYSKFTLDAKEHFSSRTVGLDPYIALHNAYKQIAPILNSSEIEPRTPDGRAHLWDFICQWVYFPNESKDDIRRRFLLDCIHIRFYVSKLYGIEHPIPSPQSSSESKTDADIPQK